MSEEQNPEMPAPADDNPHAAEFAVLEALKAEVESLKDQRLRALAEVENIRRRAEKERAEASQYAMTKFARDMLGIADNFSRALAACPPAAREAARFLLVTPPLPLIARPPYAALAASAVALLPGWARFPLRLPYFPLLEEAAIRVPGRALVEGIRWALTADAPPAAPESETQ